jgi:hypothetical protein
MKLKKGSAEAKRYMASIRAKKKGPKKAAVKKVTVKKAPVKKTVKKAPVKSIHKDTKSHNVKISVVSGIIKLSNDEKKFLENEGKKSKGYKYRAKVLWGDWIVLKEKENGQPIQKFIVDSIEIAQFLAKQLNKGQNLSKVKGKKIK